FVLLNALSISPKYPSLPSQIPWLFLSSAISLFAQKLVGSLPRIAWYSPSTFGSIALIVAVSPAMIGSAVSFLIHPLLSIEVTTSLSRRDPRSVVRSSWAEAISDVRYSPDAGATVGISVAALEAGHESLAIFPESDVEPSQLPSEPV